MTQSLPNSHRLDRARRPMLIGAAVCLALLLLGIFLMPGQAQFFRPRPAQFFRSWLFAWIFWFGISLGAMGLVMMHYLLGGAWGYLIRRFGEAAGMCIPLLAILFIPVIIGISYVYPWADKSLLHDAVIQHKSSYLNFTFWVLRAVLCFVVFSLLAWGMRSNSLAMDRNPRPELMARLRKLSTAGLVIYFVLMSMASIDWIMSREPHWVSTVFAFIVITSQALSGICFLIVMVALYSNEPPLKDALQPNYLNDLASVAILFVIFWAYLCLSQFLITWLGNDQTEIQWYVDRTYGYWRWIGGALIVLHFLVPFLLLLMRPIKRKMGRLAAVAGGVLFMRVIDVLYWVTPADPHGATWGAGRWVYAELMNLLALLAIGGFWMVMFLWLLKDVPLLPIGDPIPVAAKKHGHGPRTVSGAVE